MILIQEKVPNTQFVIMPTAFPMFQRSIFSNFLTGAVDFMSERCQVYFISVC